MTVRFYIMPMLVVNDNYRGPKYLRWRFNPEGLNVTWSAKDFGYRDTCIAAADVDTAQHQTLAGYSDVIAAPANIDNVIDTEAKRDNVRDALESLHVPGQWVHVDMTYREVLRPVTHLFLLAQRYHALTAEAYGTGRRLVEPGLGYTLDTLVSNIPAQVRSDLNQAAQSLGYDTSQVQQSWMYRRALKHLGDQWGDQPVEFGLTSL
jgi:hypothetical protein